MFFLFVFFFVFSCSSNVELNFKAKIIVYNKGVYNFETVEFKTLKNLKTMNGDYAQILGNSFLYSDDTFFFEGGKKEYFEYKEFSLDYFLVDGVVFPKNFESLCALSLYFHYEKVVQFWIENIDKNFSKFIGKINIFFHPHYRMSHSSKKTYKDNAFYSSDFDSIAFFDSDSFSFFDFSLSLSVLAHEFGHVVFNRFAEKKSSFFYSRCSLRGVFVLDILNEGLSDFFAWVISDGMADFSYISDDLKKRIPPVSWNSHSLENKSDYYSLGSVLCSSFFDLVVNYGSNKFFLMKRILIALDSFHDVWISHSCEDIGEYLFINEFLKTSGDRKSIECFVFKKWYQDSLNQKFLNEQCSGF